MILPARAQLSANFHDITSESAALYTSHFEDDGMDEVYDISMMYLVKNGPFYDQLGHKYDRACMYLNNGIRQF